MSPFDIQRQSADIVAFRDSTADQHARIAILQPASDERYVKGRELERFHRKALKLTSQLTYVRTMNVAYKTAW